MRTAATLLLLGMWSLAAAASGITSAYTDLDIDKCKLVNQSQGEGEWAEWQCPGLKGNFVRVSEDDLRYTVSYGRDAEHQCAAQQTFGKFNYLGPRIEWRLENGRPFATILRWYQSSDEVKTNWLVVTKYDGIEACHVAYVDPALPNANAVARQKADDIARAFNCSNDKPQIVSQKTIQLEKIVSGWPCPVE